MVAKLFRICGAPSPVHPSWMIQQKSLAIQWMRIHLPDSFCRAVKLDVVFEEKFAVNFKGINERLHQCGTPRVRPLVRTCLNLAKIRENPNRRCSTNTQ